jgi:NADH-quinone oxidoreductase subunit A
MVVYVIAIGVLVAALVGASFLLGERHRERATAEPFESGIVSVGYGRFRLSAQFYLVAITFVIFDVEAVFLFAWAVALRETGWEGYVGAVIFIAILTLALVYEWRLGVLDWAPAQRKVRRQHALRGCEKTVASSPRARRTGRSDETYQVDRRGASTAQRGYRDAQ